MTDRTLNKALSLTILIIFFITPISAFAQNIPPGEEPGAQASRFQQEAEKRKEELEKKKARELTIELIEGKKPAAPEARVVSTVLKELKITGMTLFKPEDFRPLYEGYLGKKVSFDDVQLVADKISQRYKERGYLTTIAYIPEQKIDQGIVEIRVAEGKLGKVNVEGNKWFPLSLIKKYIHIKKNEVLSVPDLQKDIMRINRNPDLQVDPVLKAGGETGTSDLTLKIKDVFPYHVGVSVDNQGSRLVGKYRASLSGRGLNVTGHNDSLFVNTLISRGSSGEFVSYTLPADTYGAALGLDFSYFEMKLGEEYKALDITGKTLDFTPHVSKELYLSEGLQADAELGLQVKSIKKKMGAQVTSDDQLRLPYLSFDISVLDSLFGGGQTTFSPKASFGTEDFLGASSRNHPTTNRQGTGGSFFKYEQSLNRIQRFIFDSYISIRTLFQWSSTILPSSEEFQIGGANSVRGYPEGDYVADMGGVLNCDWVFPMYFIPKDWKLPHSDRPLWRQIEGVFFADFGYGRLRKTLPGEEEDKFLAGIGGGLRIRLYDKFSLRLEWAKDIGDDPISGAGPSTFHITFQGEI